MPSRSFTPPMRQAPSLHEKPLSAFKRYLLILSILGILLGCTIGALAMVAILLVILAVEALVLLALLRIGLSRLLLPTFLEHFHILWIFPRSLWLGKDSSTKVYLQREEAPRLFEVLSDYAQKLGIQPPERIQIVEACTAWVLLGGWRKGAGKTTLGLGFDLLAGLDVEELTAVIAHEMAHAKKVNRGFNQFHRFALNRFLRVRSLLHEVVFKNRGQEKSVELALRLFQISDKLCKVAARLAATQSRQDEFDADALAATLARPAALASSLRKLPKIAQNAASVPWAARLTRLESGLEYARWLQEKLTQNDATEDVESKETPDAFDEDPYSTHPSNADRIAALPPHEEKTTAHTPALAWFTNPDHVAKQLISFQMADLLKKEREDLHALKKELRAWRRLRKINASQWGVIVGGIVAFWFIASLGEKYPSGWLLLGFGAVIGLAVTLYRLSMDKDLPDLVFPSFETLQRALDARPRGEALTKRENELVEAASQIADAAALENLAAKAFVDGDYLSIHVHARLALRKSEKRPGPIAFYVIGTAAFGQNELCRSNLVALAQKQGLRGPNILALTGYAMWLSQHFMQAEAFLIESLATRREATALALLADSRFKRGKLHTALETINDALSLGSEMSALVHLKAKILIALGQVSPARALLAKLSAQSSDPEVMYTRLSLAVNTQDREAIDALLQEIPADLAGNWLVSFASLLLEVDDKVKARELLERAAALAFYPEAHLVLSRLAHDKKELIEAKSHSLAALAGNREVGPGSASVFSFFGSALVSLYLCHPKISRAEAWLFRFPKIDGAGPFAGVTLLVYGENRNDAGRLLMEVLTAASGGPGSKTPAWVACDRAPSDAQPEGAVFPGVQRLWSAV